MFQWLILVVNWYIFTLTMEFQNLIIVNLYVLKFKNEQFVFGYFFTHSFKIRPGPVCRPGTQDWNGAGLKKNKEKKLGVTRQFDPARPRQKPSCTWLKKLTLATRSKPVTRALDRVGHQTESKNYGLTCLFSIS